MTHKLRSEMSSQKIDTSADIMFGSLALLEGFVILDLKYCFGICLCSMYTSLLNLQILAQKGIFSSFAHSGGHYVTIATH